MHFWRRTDNKGLYKNTLYESKLLRDKAYAKSGKNGDIGEVDDKVVHRVKNTIYKDSRINYRYSIETESGTVYSGVLADAIKIADLLAVFSESEVLVRDNYDRKVL